MANEKAEDAALSVLAQRKKIAKQQLSIRQINFCEKDPKALLFISERKDLLGTSQRQRAYLLPDDIFFPLGFGVLWF